MGQFSRVCLVVTILLLATIALHHLLSPMGVRATEHLSYLVVSTSVDPAAMQKELDKRAGEGWELAAPVVSEQMSGVSLIFRKKD